MADLTYFTLDGVKINVKDLTARNAASAAQTKADSAASDASTAKSDAATAKTTANEAATGASNALSRVAAIEKESRLEMTYSETTETITVTTKTHATT